MPIEPFDDEDFVESNVPKEKRVQALIDKGYYQNITKEELSRLMDREDLPLSEPTPEEINARINWKDYPNR